MADSVEKIGHGYHDIKALEIEIFTLSSGFDGLRFRVAARKKGVFSGQYSGSLEEPTFSTESADCCAWREAENDPSGQWIAMTIHHLRSSGASTKPERMQMICRLKQPTLLVLETINLAAIGSEQEMAFLL
ncbi:hypothetical protein HX829_25520 [Pseudomonas gingeri]|uniref:Uncharacterized protein n=1 Tax=Pseudomonas gingeri TaxID=117681 RepID=A0A7Y7WHX5_9PSED|nr:hypothetical protein [Pseudomonas gingeri]